MRDYRRIPMLSTEYAALTYSAGSADCEYAVVVFAARNTKMMMKVKSAYTATPTSLQSRCAYRPTVFYASFSDRTLSDQY